MAQLSPNYHNVRRRIHSQLPWRRRGTSQQHYIVLVSSGRLCNSSCDHNVRFVKCSKKLVRENRLVQCSSSTSSSSSAELQVDGKYGGNGKKQFGDLVRENGWKIRRMVETDDEMREVANIQAEAFHEPVILFNDTFFEFFQAEVLAGLLYKLRNSPPHRYACLVAEPVADTAGLKQELVGVVDVTVYSDNDVLNHLSGADEYLYVSGIAVLNKFRRQKVATALLKACDVLALLWGFEYLVLRAYEDDWGAQKLYTSAGYTIVSGDPPWITWIGRRRRVLMIKRFDHIQ